MLHGFSTFFSGVLAWILLIMVWFERSLHSTQVRGQSLHGGAQGRMGLQKLIIITLQAGRLTWGIPLNIITLIPLAYNLLKQKQNALPEQVRILNPGKQKCLHYQRLINLHDWDLEIFKFNFYM